MVVALYTRQSTDKQKSIPFQMELGEKFAKSKGWIFKHYSDKGISGGAKIKDRKAFAQMLDDILDGEVQKVWIWEQDRLEREPSTWFAFCTTIIDAKVDLYENGKLIDLDDDNVFMLKGFSSIMNRSERRRSANKSKEKINANVEKGQIHGLIPYGYKGDENKKMVIDPEEAKIVRDIFQWSLDGLGYRAIAHKLNDLKIPTAYNKMVVNTDPKRKRTYSVDVNRNNDLPEKIVIKQKAATKWVAGTVKNIIFRETYIGKRKFGEQTNLEVEAIINENLFNKVHRAISDKAKKSGKKTFHKYLLNNLVFCSRCSKRYTGREVKNHFYYRCASLIRKGESCGNRGVQMKILNELMIALVYGNLYDKVKDTLQNLDTSEKDRIKEEIRVSESVVKSENKLLTKLEDDYADGTFNKAQYQRQYKRITSRKKDLQYKLENQKELLDNYTEMDNVLESMEEVLIKPFLNMMEYPFDTSYGNPFEKIMERMLKVQVGQIQPYESQQKAIKQFIDKIDINHLEGKEVTTITVKYRLPIEDEVYILDKYNLLVVSAKSRSIVWANKENPNNISERKKVDTENYLGSINI